MSCCCSRIVKSIARNFSTEQGYDLIVRQGCLHRAAPTRRVSRLLRGLTSRCRSSISYLPVAKGERLNGLAFDSLRAARKRDRAHRDTRARRGGQNVNKVSNAIHLRFDIRASSLPDQIKQRLLAKRDQRINDDGVVVIKAQSFRSLEKNRDDALARLECAGCERGRQFLASAVQRSRPRRLRKNGLKRKCGAGRSRPCAAGAIED